jgi:hypothetical protein
VIPFDDVDEARKAVARHSNPMDGAPGGEA